MKKYLPTREQLRAQKSLQFLGDRIFEPNLWHVNRYSLSIAALVGGFCCWLPLPFQMIPAVLLCLVLRCNIPFSVVLVWVSNPVTMGPMMYFAYLLGASILEPALPSDPIEPSFEWFTSHLSAIWQPLLLGCFISGVTMALTGFSIIRIYYRWRIYRYKERKRRKR